MKPVVSAIAAIGLASACAEPITFDALMARPRPEADHRIAYGPAPEQFGDLYTPAGGGSRPVVVLIHGGCWQASLPGLELTAYAADDLKRRGFAVWNIEYRRLGQAGGGYPGTFTDVAEAVDHLRVLAKTYPIDLDRVVLVGHSAGGHLAAWAAARSRLPASSPLHRPDPLPVRGVVSLAGINDLKDYRDGGAAACGGPQIIDQLLGADTRAGQAIYGDTSPAALLPIGAAQVVVSGDRDDIVPAALGAAYADKAKAAGDEVERLDLANAGHFELVDPTSAAWAAIIPAIGRLSR